MTYDYPVWYILLSLLISGLLSFLVYKKNIKTSWKYTFMAFLRFVTLFTLFFSIGRLMIVDKVESKSKPKLIIAFDQSESMLNNSDSKKLNSIFRKLNSDEILSNYNVRNIGFGNSVLEIDKPSFSDIRTNFVALEHNLDLISDDDSRAIIVSDGNINKGLLSAFKTEKKYTIDVVGVGDTISTSSLVISKIHHNRNVVLGNRFPLEIFIESEGVIGNVKLEISEGNEIISTDNIFISPNGSGKVSSRHEYVIKTRNLGEHVFKVKVVSQDNSTVFHEEYTTVSVVKNKGKVLIVYFEVNPDISLFKRNLVSRNYDVLVFKNTLNKKDLNNFDFIVDFGGSIDQNINIPKVIVNPHSKKNNIEYKEIVRSLDLKQVSFFGVDSNSKSIELEIDNLWKANLKEANLEGKEVSNLFDVLIKEIEVMRYSNKFNVLYNDVYNSNEDVVVKLINTTSTLNNVDAKAKLIINGRKQVFDFIGDRGMYLLNLGKMDENEYSLRIVINNKTYKVINFEVKNIDFERLEKGQNIDLLKSIALYQKSNYYNSSDINTLLESLTDNTAIKTSYKTVKINLIENWLFIILIPLFLGLEWFLRKRNGLY